MEQLEEQELYVMKHLKWIGKENEEKADGTV